MQKTSVTENKADTIQLGRRNFCDSFNFLPLLIMYTQQVKVI
jgi:hypothetical protein